VEQQEAAIKQRLIWPFSRLPLARARKLQRKLPRKLLRRLPRRLLGRTTLRKRRLLKRPRKAQLCLTHQPQNFAMSTRPSTTRPFS
jgi:hypothetical protein